MESRTRNGVRSFNLTHGSGTLFLMARPLNSRNRVRSFNLTQKKQRGRESLCEVSMMNSNSKCNAGCGEVV